MTGREVRQEHSGAPWLSVLMPTKNGRPWLAHALRGVAAQGRAVNDLEILVVDDGSIDGTLEVVASFRDRLPIRLLPGPPVGNWASSTNRALAEAKGSWVCMLHQDDFWLPGRLERLRRLLESQSEVVLAFHPVWFVDSAGWRLGQWRAPLSSGRSLDGGLVREQLLVQNFVPLPACLIRRDVASASGGLDESLWYAADWDLWLKACAQGRVLYDSTPAACFRVHDRSQSATGDANEMRRQLEIVLARHLGRRAEGAPSSTDLAATFSIVINAALAHRGHGWLEVAKAAAHLSPRDWKRFLSASRIGERFAARLVGLVGHTHGPPLHDAEAAWPTMSENRLPAKEVPRVSILVVSQNDEETIAAKVREARAGLETAGVPGEILVIDGGSTDGTVALARGEGVAVLNVQEPGLGAAVRRGMEVARGDWIIVSESGCGDDLGHVAPFIERLKAGVDLAVGCRLRAGNGTCERGALSISGRLVGLPLLSGFARLVASSHLHDLVGSPRAFQRDIVRSLDLRTIGPELGTELVLKAIRYGLRVEEIPVTYRAPAAGLSRRRARLALWQHLRLLLLFSPRALFLAPGLAAVLLGIVAGSRLLAGPLKVGPVVLDTNSLLVSAMSLVVGFQFCLSAVFAEIFAVTEGLLPPRPVYAVLFRLFTLERGLLAGALLVLSGSAFLVRALLFWEEAGFQAISYSSSLRMVIPAIVGVTLGVQVVFSGFFLSLLSLRRR